MADINNFIDYVQLELPYRISEASGDLPPFGYIPVFRGPPYGRDTVATHPSLISSSNFFEVFDEGISIGSDFNKLNFVGYVTASDGGGGQVNVTVSGSGAGGGASVFTDLSDTPSTYAGSANYIVRVNSSPNALEFVNGSTIFQSVDATLTALAGLTTSADQMIYSTGSDAFSMTGLTSFARTLLDDTNQSTAQSTLGVDPAGTDNSTDVTLDGTPDYITIAGQTITRNPIDLAADVTGDLPLLDGGTNASLTAVNGAVVYSTASAMALSAAGSAGQILQSNGAASPVWSTATFPATATGTGTILRANGTNWVATTATYPATTTANQILYSSSTNVVGEITAAASSILVTNGSSVPSLATDIPTAVTIGSAYIYRASGTDVAVADGGTNISSYAIGDIIYASGATALDKLAGVATGNVLISGGVTTAPSWGKVGLTTHISGTLAVGSGGTNLSTIAAGSILAANSADTLSAITSTSALKVLQNSAGTISWAGTTGTGNVVYDTGPTLGSITTSNVTMATGGALRTSTTTGNTLLIQAYDTDTGPAYTTFITLTAGTTPTCDLATSVTIGSAYIYRASGTDVPLLDGGTNASLTANVGGIVYSTASAFAILSGTAAAGQILRSGASAAPTWSTATYPATTTASQILYSSSTNVVGEITTGNSGVLVTSGAGVPSIATDIPTAVTIGSAYIYRAGGTDVAVADGGTGLSTYTQYRMLYASATNTLSQTTNLTWNETTLNVTGLVTATSTVQGAALISTGNILASGSGAYYLGGITSANILASYDTADLRIGTGSNWTTQSFYLAGSAVSRLSSNGLCLTGGTSNPPNVRFLTNGYNITESTGIWGWNMYFDGSWKSTTASVYGAVLSGSNTSAIVKMYVSSAAATAGKAFAAVRESMSWNADTSVTLSNSTTLAGATTWGDHTVSAQVLAGSIHSFNFYYSGALTVSQTTPYIIVPFGCDIVKVWAEVLTAPGASKNISVSIVSSIYSDTAFGTTNVTGTNIIATTAVYGSTTTIGTAGLASGSKVRAVITQDAAGAGADISICVVVRKTGTYA